MRTVFNEVPMLRLVLPLVIGVSLEIAVNAAFPTSQWGIISGTAVAIIALLYLLFFSTRSIAHQFKWRFAEGVSLLCLFTALGYLLAWFHSEINSTQHFSKTKGKAQFLIVTLRQYPVIKEKSVSVIGEVKSTVRQHEATAVTGKLLLSFRRDSSAEQLRYGDKLLIPAAYNEFAAPQNPNEFDFRRYQNFRGIYHRTFLQNGRWELLQHGQGNVVLSLIFSARKSFLHIIQQYVTDKNSLGVASAMLLGYNDFMNDDLTQAYATAGVLHVLSVSGLHVGIMFYMLHILLGWMDKRGQRWRVAKTAVIILFIWFYASLTGLQPSVMRAAAMFSMIQLGKALYRHVNIYNILAASIFLLVLFQPFIIMEIGFRLSYLAVIGIVYFYPKIYALLTVKNKWADKVWSISAVSIAAQLTTFPISIYYFHQFPLLFLLPNLIVIPLSNFILFLGTGLFVCAWVPYLNSALGWLLAHLLTLLNGGIFLVEKIPYNLIEGISLNVLEMLLLYTLFLTGAWFIESKRPKALLASLVVLLFFSTAAFYRFASAQGQSLFTVYHVKNESALTFLQNGVATYRFSDTLYTNRSAMLYHIKPHWWDNGIRQEKAVTATSDSLPFGELLYQNGKKILVVNQEVSKVNAAFARRLQVDYVVLSKNAKVYLSNLAKMVDFSTVIFDSGVKRYYVPYWIKDCKSLHLNYWDVNTQGAFTAKL